MSWNDPAPLEAGLAASIVASDRSQNPSQLAPSGPGLQPSQGQQLAPQTTTAPLPLGRPSGFEGHLQATASVGGVAAPAALRLPPLGALTAIPALATSAPAPAGLGLPPQAAQPQPGQDAAAV
eukprot:2868093-Pyramimonas_sp.AAC.1